MSRGHSRLALIALYMQSGLVRMVYFIGNVLTSHEVSNAHPERDKEYFHVTPEEAAGMDITGLPVHLEHAENVQVGNVQRTWDDPDGTKWVVANIDTTTIEGKFVRNDLASETPVYGSLSLQHMYRKYADGKSTKEPLEISICKDPRRPGCTIVHSSSLRSSSTGAHGYKVACHAHRHMDTVTALAATATGNEIPTVTSSTMAAPDALAPAVTPSTTQLMAEVVEASRQNGELQKQLDDKTAELANHSAAEAAATEKAVQQQTQVARELGDAVLEHVARLDPSLANEETTKAIDILREKYPQQIARVLEVACCASKRATDLEEQLKVAKAENERKLMEQAYHAAVATRTGCHGGPPAEEATSAAVRASKRQREDHTVNPFAVRQSTDMGHSGGPAHVPEQTLLQIQAAYNGLKGSGSTADTMRTVAGIIGQQRERGFR